MNSELKKEYLGPELLKITYKGIIYFVRLRYSDMDVEPQDKNEAFLKKECAPYFKEVLENAVNGAEWNIERYKKQLDDAKQKLEAFKSKNNL